MKGTLLPDGEEVVPSESAGGEKKEVAQKQNKFYSGGTGTMEGRKRGTHSGREQRNSKKEDSS